jgi:hypothetical protein
MGKIRIEGGRFLSKKINLNDINEDLLLDLSEIQSLAEKAGDSTIGDVCDEILEEKSMEKMEIIKKVDYIYLIADNMINKVPEFSEIYNKIMEKCSEISKI